LGAVGTPRNEKKVAVGNVFFVLRVFSLLTIKKVLLLLMCKRNEVFAVIWAAAGLRIAQIEPFCSVFMSVGHFGPCLNFGKVF